MTADSPWDRRARAVPPTPLGRRTESDQTGRTPAADSRWARPAGDDDTDHGKPSADDLDWVRRTLVELDDRQRALPADDLAARHAILNTIDGLRTMLRSGYADRLAAVRAAWEERAGRKGGHEVDLEAIAGMVRGMVDSPGR